MTPGPDGLLARYADVSLDRVASSCLRDRESAEEAVLPGEKTEPLTTGEATVRWPPPGAADGTVTQMWAVGRENSKQARNGANLPAHRPLRIAATTLAGSNWDVSMITSLSSRHLSSRRRNNAARSLGSAGRR